MPKVKTTVLVFFLCQMVFFWWPCVITYVAVLLNSFCFPILIVPFNSVQLYKGKLENNSYVAIRSLALSKKFSIQNLKVRLDLLSKLHHPNLVSLLGHCIDGGGQDDSSTPKVYLVYEYVPNGNYRAHLSGWYGIIVCESLRSITKCFPCLFNTIDCFSY